MARNPKQAVQTKKHLARLERERLQRRYILIGSIVVLVLVFGLVAFGIVDQYVLQPARPVAVVNGENITTRQFQAQTRYARQGLISNAMNTVQFMQLFGSSPETQASFQNQLLQIQSQLSPTIVGQQVIDQLVANALIRQEAEERGITVTEEEIDKAIQEAFGYFPEGTPTPAPTSEPEPTSTLNPTQLALAPPTSTPTATAEITSTATLTETEPGAEATAATPATATAEPSITPTQAPTATATPYTFEGFQSQYNEAVENLKQINFSEENLRYIFEMEVYQEKLMEAVLEERNVSREQEQVWARHILVADEETANQVLERLNQGEDWSNLAAELSTDTSNKDLSGDLGWFGPGEMTSAFEQAAYALEIGETSQPVQTEFGWHIIQVLGHEVRTLTDSEFEQLRQREFQNWLTETREAAEITINDEVWTAAAPTEPTLPPEVVSIIQQGQSPQPVLPEVLPTEAAP